MAKNKIAMVSVSKDGNWMFTDEDIAKASEVLGPDFTFIKIENKNGMKLTEMYNQYLGKFRAEGGYDYVFLMHADVRFDIPAFVEKLDFVHGKYDIIGMVGCKELDTAASPLNWYTGSNFKPLTRYGCVTCIENMNRQDFFNATDPTTLDTSVAAIDGLCIVFTQAALDSGIEFDPRFSFDQYDTDLSLECVVKRKMRLGVVVERSLVHGSMGMSITSRRFLAGEIELRKKWGLSFPKSLVRRMGAVAS